MYVRVGRPRTLSHGPKGREAVGGRGGVSNGRPLGPQGEASCGGHSLPLLVAAPRVASNQGRPSVHTGQRGTGRARGDAVHRDCQCHKKGTSNQLGAKVFTTKPSQYYDGFRLASATRGGHAQAPGVPGSLQLQVYRYAVRHTETSGRLTVASRSGPGASCRRDDGGSRAVATCELEHKFGGGTHPTMLS